MKFDFGKYKGTEVKEVPVGYLTWCLENAAQSCSPALIEAIRDQLEVTKLDRCFEPPVVDEAQVELQEPEEELLQPEVELLQVKAELLQARADFRKARADLDRGFVDYLVLQSRMNDFSAYFEKWHRVVYELLHLDRAENHTAKLYFDQLKKEIEKWKQQG